MSDLTNVVVTVDDVAEAKARLASNNIVAGKVTDCTIEIPLQVEIGDEVVMLADGSLRVVQDAMVGRLYDAEIVEVMESPE
jgi:hypothetical protein